MSANVQSNGNANTSKPSRDRGWLAAYIAAAIVGVIGLGSLAAHDLQPLTQQHSFWAELSYVLTHPDALLHLLPFVVIYVITMGVLSFAHLVLSRLAPRWAAEFADGLDAWLRQVFSRFYARYSKNLHYHLRPLDQKGITDPGPWSLDLDQVFVDLKVEPQALTAGKANPVQPPSPELRERQDRFFRFLTPRHGSIPHLVIIGPPGSGKTTMLRHAALVLLSDHKAQKKAGAPASLRQLVPILLYLREHAAQVQQTHRAQRSGDRTTSYSLEDAVNDHLRFHAPAGLLVPKGWMLRQLKRGRCLVLLDGLDEVADADQRRLLVDWVQEQMDQYHTCRIAVTSRPHGYKGNTLNGVTVLGMCAYSPTQIKEFVRKWYHATEVRRQGNRDDTGVKQQALLDADKLLYRLNELPDIYELATNPLLLTMICLVHLYKGSLPKRRVDLYKDACDVFLVARQRAKGLHVTLTEDQAKRVLAPLAWAMMTTPTATGPGMTTDGRRWPKAHVEQAIAEPLALLTDMGTAEFLQYLHESGLFLELEPGEYGFAHLTFQEYLGAVHAVTGRLVSSLITHIGDSWWEETIRLYCAQADATRATSVIEACLPQGETLPSADALTLALACLEEAPLVRPATRDRVRQFIDRCVEAPDAERQHIAAEALLAKRLKDLLYLGDTTRYSPTLITCVEYQLFLDEAHVRGENHEPPHWTTPHFAPGEGSNPVLGMLPDDAAAFCAWLTKRNASKGNIFRVPFAREAQTQQLQSTLQNPDFPSAVWVIGEAGQIVLTHATILPIADAQLDRIVHHDAEEAKHLNGVVVIRERDLDLVRNRYRARDFVRDFVRDHVLAVARSLALDRALANDLARASGLANDLARTRDRASDLVRGLAFVLDRDRASALADDLGRANGSASALASDLARSALDASGRASALASDLARVSARAGEIARVSEGELAGEFARIIVLASELASAQDRPRALASASVTDLALISVLAIVSQGADDLAHDLASSLALARIRTSALARDLASVRDFTRASGLVRARALASDLARGLVRDFAHANTLADSHAVLRIDLLTSAAILLNMKGQPGIQRPPWIPTRRRQLSASQVAAQTVAALIDMCAALVVLEGRRIGRLKPSEGILVTCDLHQEASTPSPLAG